MAATYGDRSSAAALGACRSRSAAGRVNAEIGQDCRGPVPRRPAPLTPATGAQENFEKLKGQMGTVNDDSIGLEALERDATVNRNLLRRCSSRQQSTARRRSWQANAKLVSRGAAGGDVPIRPKALIASWGRSAGCCWAARSR